MKITALIAGISAVLALLLHAAPAHGSSMGLSGTPINIGAGVDIILDAPLNDLEDTEYELRAFELNIGAPVDPYFDMLVTISYHEDEFEVEEAWVSTVLPLNLKLLTGREFIPFGYLNRIHEHDFPQADQPYVLEGLITDHGLIGDGGHLEYLAPFMNPTLTLNFGAYQRIGGSVGRRVKGTPLLGRVQSYYESPAGAHSILAGASFLRGVGSVDHMEDRLDEEFRTDDPRALGKIRNIAGIDLKYRFLSLGRTYRGLTVGGEYLYIDYVPYGSHLHYEEHPDFDPGADHGLYLYAQWNFNRFWGIGYRFDNTDMLFSSLEDDGRLTAHSLYAEWRGTEFSRLRLQYQYLDEPGASDPAHRLMLQGTFFIGWHPPHRF